MGQNKTLLEIQWATECAEIEFHEFAGPPQWQAN